MSTWPYVGAAAMPSVRGEPWREHAACAGRDPSWWDPVDGRVTAADVTRWSAGAVVCLTCPVVDACHAAVTRADAGTIRAGGLVGEDGIVGPIRRATVGRPPACGTDAARRRHVDRAESCAACAVDDR